MIVKRHVLVLAFALVCMAMLTTLFGASRSSASTTPGPSKLALIKQNDLAAIGKKYAPNFNWIACGLSTAGRNGTKTGTCRKGQVPIYASYWALKKAIRSGQVKPGMTILFDQEIWKWTPAREQAHPEYYIRAAAQLAHANGVFIIESVYEPTTAGEIAVEVAAAPYADVISIQSQKSDQHPGRFTSYVSQSVAAIRAVSPTVPIMAGLATDAGGQPITAGEMTREYDQTYNMVSYFWLNAAEWAPPRGTGCAPRGCGRVGDRFLADIGVGASRAG
ncbi:MAG TPA: hypothetical protein VME44_02360 [Streptosporangiaceae bacterium]|nr:hypothetical protein [Streptosporangiaceae bacterium]